MAKLAKYITALFLLSMAIIPAVYANGETVVIDTPSLNVRSGPGLSYPVIGSLKAGEKAAVTSTVNDWHEIKLNGETGFIASWLVKRENGGQAEPALVISKVDALNIRSSASLNAAVIGQLNAGDEALQTGQSGEWAEIEKDGLKGFVHEQYITVKLQDKQPETEPAEESDQADEEEKPSAQQQVRTASSDQFTIHVDALNIRKKPDQSSKIIGTAKRGETFAVEEVSGNWVKISAGKKKSGYVYSFHGVFSEKQPAKTANAKVNKTVTVLTNGTNIRSAASTASEVVIRANAGEKLTVTGEEDDWYQIILPSGETAYVANWVVADSDSRIETAEKKQPKRLKGTLNGLTIVVDAGHGGNDRGTTGYAGTDEKELTLMTAELLSAKLKAAGANVVMTRESDTYVGLRKRVSVSHMESADAFISLHYDAHDDTSITGFTTYYTHGFQKSLAEAVNDGLASNLTIRNRGAQPSDFLVVRENKRNAILIELGYLSNPAEERLLTTEVFREQATHGIYTGLLKYFDSID